MRRISWIQIIGASIVVASLAAFAVLLAVSVIERRQAGETAGIEPYMPSADARVSGVAVVYYSRSGNTGLAARHVARHLQARLYALNVPNHEIGVGSLVGALKAAVALKRDAGALPRTWPKTIDLASFAAVWLGSPVWLYSPASPIWSFVENNRFDGKHVVLFNTYNSHIGDEYISAFRDKVMSRGARSFEHRQLLRGRMIRQLSPEEMLEAIDREWFGINPDSPL